MKQNHKRGILAGLLILVMAWCAPAAGAADRKEAGLRIKEATLVVSKFMNAEDQDTVRKLLKKCRAVVIVPDMVKAGFVVGASSAGGCSWRAGSTAAFPRPAS